MSMITDKTPIDLLSERRMELLKLHEQAKNKRVAAEKQLQATRAEEVELEAKLINYVQAEETLSKASKVMEGEPK